MPVRELWIVFDETRRHALSAARRAGRIGVVRETLAITAYAKQEDRERALAAGFLRFLSKPVELGEFISVVAEASQNPEQ